jgi:hypothetical protein
VEDVPEGGKSAEATSDPAEQVTQVSEEEKVTQVSEEEEVGGAATRDAEESQRPQESVPGGQEIGGQEIGGQEIVPGERVDGPQILKSQYLSFIDEY